MNFPEVKDWVEQLHESLPEWFDFAGDALQQKTKSFDEAGGMYESLNYANFGIQEAPIVSNRLDKHSSGTKSRQYTPIGKTSELLFSSMLSSYRYAV